uniref:Transformer-2 beta n=3 Tax=Lygus hesperus TaxID=30085 RepID=A0A0K8SDT0_LYGHE
MGVVSDQENADHVETRDSRDESPASGRSSGSAQKMMEYKSRSRSKGRSHSPSPSDSKSKKKYSSRSRSRKSKYRSRSRSPRKYSRSSRHSKSRSYSRSRSGSESPYRKRGRTHSRSPMSNRRRHTSSRVSDTRDNPQPNKCLGVFGLSLYTTENQLHQIFSKYGRLERVQVIIDAKTGRSRGFCFVYYEHLEDARNAKEQCTGMEIGGRKIRVDYSITERAHTPTPGIYMGKPTYEDRPYSSRRRDRYDDDYYGGGSSHRGSRYRSPSPYYSSSRSRRSRYDRSRSRSYSPRRY